MQCLSILIASVLFALGGCVHLLRLIYPFEFKIGSHSLPIWASALIGILGLILSYFLYFSLRTCLNA